MTTNVKRKYAVVDLEATSASSNAKIIQIGIVIIQDGQIVETYETDVNPHEELDEHIRQLQGFILAQAGIYSYIGTSTVSDRNAHQALEWAKLDVNGRSHNNHKPAIFHRSKSLLSGFFHHGSQESIA